MTTYPVAQKNHFFNSSAIDPFGILSSIISNLGIIGPTVKEFQILDFNKELI